MHDVIGVHARDERRAWTIDDLIESRGQSAASSVREHRDARVGERTRDGEGAIRRTVIDEEQLEGIEGLREDGADRVTEHALLVQERNRDGDAGLGHKRARRWSRLDRRAYRPAAESESASVVV